MIRLPPEVPRTATRFPCTPRFLAGGGEAREAGPATPDHGAILSRPREFRHVIRRHARGPIARRDNAPARAPCFAPTPAMPMFPRNPMETAAHGYPRPAAHPPLDQRQGPEDRKSVV